MSPDSVEPSESRSPLYLGDDPFFTRRRPALCLTRFAQLRQRITRYRVSFLNNALTSTTTRTEIVTLMSWAAVALGDKTIAVTTTSRNERSLSTLQLVERVEAFDTKMQALPP